VRLASKLTGWSLDFEKQAPTSDESEKKPARNAENLKAQSDAGGEENKE